MASRLQMRPLPQIPRGATRMRACMESNHCRGTWHVTGIDPPIQSGGGLSQHLCCAGRGAAAGKKRLNHTPVKVIQRMSSLHSIVGGHPVRSVTRCLSIISETLNRKHWLANGQSGFRSDRGSVKGLYRGVCSRSECVFLTGRDGGR